MIIVLLRKRYNIPITFFLYFSLLTGGFLHAAPPGKSKLPERIGNRLYFTPACPIVAQNFNTSYDVNGATSDPSSVGWYLDASKVPNAVYFSIKSHRIKAQTLGGEGVWYSQVFNISGYTGIQVDAKISAEGSFTSSEYVKVSYILDGGPETLIGEYTGNFGTPLVTSAQMTGSKVQIVIRLYNVSAGNNDYYIEQYDVFKEAGPCTVTSGITVSGSASNSGVLTCANPSTTLSASTTASGTTTYSWTGPNGFTATGATVTATTAGTYTVTGTNSAGTGTATVTVTSSTTPPAGVTATESGSLSCSTTSVTLTGSSTTSGTTFSWSGPSGFTATGATATATTAGTYTVTATNPSTGCTATASTTVTQNLTAPAGVTASNNGPLTCSATSVTLSGSSTLQQGVTYAWTGPGSFAATGTSATVTVPGTYTLTATYTSTGCTAKATTTVVQNIAAPAGVTAINNGPQTCSNVYVLLTGSSTTTGTTFAWTGPNGFTATSATANLTSLGQDGIYTLTATNPTNGCTAIATTVVAEDDAVPTDVSVGSSTPSPVLNCTNTSLTLTASSSTTGVTYAWRIGTTGSTVLGTSASLTVSQPNAYDVLVTNPANGCAILSGQTVTQNITPPASVAVTTIPADAVLTCANTSVALTGTSSVSGASYSWSGPSGFTASSSSASTSTPGAYTLTATDPSNGCSAAASTTITQNIAPPSAVTIGSATGTTIINCTNPALSLTGGSTPQNVSWSWSGPNGYSASTATTNVTTQGTYTATATSMDNGCSKAANVVIGIDTATPSAVSTSSVPANATVTCSSPNVVLTGSSATPGVTYNWTGPNNFSVSGASVTVTASGNYELTVTNPGNGCSSAVAATPVTQNLGIPIAVSTITSNKLSCFTTSVTVTANSSTGGATYTWIGPQGFTADTRVISATMGGAYTVTVTNPANGCTTSKTATVAADTATPAGVTATNSGPLTCDITTVTLTGNSTTSGVSYLWNGPNGFSDAEQVSALATDSGAYVLTVTNVGNGCSTNDTTYVAADFTACSMVVRKVTSSTAATFNDSTATCGFSFKVYPNPVSTAAYVQFQCPTASQVIVGIYNNLGVLERVLFSNAVEANQSYRLMLDPGGLTAGIHYCVMRIDDKVYTQKLLLFPNRP